MKLKDKVIQLVSSATKRIGREKDKKKRERLKIIKDEFSKLADQL